MSNKISRRNFLHTAGLGTLGAAAAGLLTACGDKAASGSVASSDRRRYLHRRYLQRHRHRHQHHHPRSP